MIKKSETPIAWKLSPRSSEIVPPNGPVDFVNTKSCSSGIHALPNVNLKGFGRMPSDLGTVLAYDVYAVNTSYARTKNGFGFFHTQSI